MRSISAASQIAENRLNVFGPSMNQRSGDANACPERAVSPRVLFLVPIHNCTLDSGAGQRTQHIYRSLVESFAVDILLIPQAGAESMERVYPTLFRQIFPLAKEVWLCPGEPRQCGTYFLTKFITLKNRIWALIKPRALVYRASRASSLFCEGLLRKNNYTLIVGRYLLPTVRSGVMSAALAEQIPLFLDIDDRDEKVVESRLKSPTCPFWLRPLLSWHLGQIQRTVHDFLPKFRHIWLASSDDCAEVDHTSKSVLPNIPFTGTSTTDFFRPPVENYVCLFVGTTHRMNREGLIFFVQTCWNEIRRQVPSATLRIVGSGGWEQMSPVFDSFSGVEIVGAVPDLTREYQAALFCISPLLEGSGTKIKVLESLMNGKAVVGSAHSIRGFSDLSTGSGVLVASGPNEMVGHCVRLFQNPDEALELGRMGARAMGEGYSYAAFSKRLMADLVARLGR